MANLIKYELPSGDTILIETDEKKPAGATPVGVGSFVTDATKKIQATLNQLPDFVKSLKEEIAGRVTDANRISIEFGAKVSADVGFVVAKSQVEANFKITISWEK